MKFVQRVSLLSNALEILLNVCTTALFRSGAGPSVALFIDTLPSKDSICPVQVSRHIIQVQRVMYVRQIPSRYE
ncbi:uncharacterized protein EDB91DRAFT_200997 [Suillus paluster]|uniref:uncharacterized protein n=1 Tax=Suillus paluster TaxID=48578 RepID=UPI001B882E4F|nr:uncharacterized protein EDB91DRAFT_200997 [Suillus paluster]KAG1722835.1 hypothetical protein EDB91DRAFT_200997 [Suillus paluster]